MPNSEPLIYTLFSTLAHGATVPFSSSPSGISWHSFSFPTFLHGVLPLLTFSEVSFPNNGYLQDTKIAMGAKVAFKDAKILQKGPEPAQNLDSHAKSLGRSSPDLLESSFYAYLSHPWVFLVILPEVPEASLCEAWEGLQLAYQKSAVIFILSHPREFLAILSRSSRSICLMIRMF